MSCMMLTDKHYRDVTKTLWLFRLDPKYYFAKDIDQIPEAKWYAENNVKPPQKLEPFIMHVDPIVFLVSKWREANHFAYNERYPAHTEPFKPCDLTSGAETNLCQLLKSLQCIDYQCADWRGWNESWEGKHLASIVELVKSAIIESLPEYGIAKWGIE